MRSRARGRGVDDDDDIRESFAHAVVVSRDDDDDRWVWTSRRWVWGARARRSRIAMCAEIFCVMRCARDRASRACVATSVRAEARAVAINARRAGWWEISPQSDDDDDGGGDRASRGGCAGCDCA